jgi:hypothetical protein
MTASTILKSLVGAGIASTILSSLVGAGIASTVLGSLVGAGIASTILSSLAGAVIASTVLSSSVGAGVSTILKSLAGACLGSLAGAVVASTVLGSLVGDVVAYNQVKKSKRGFVNMARYKWEERRSFDCLPGKSWNGRLAGGESIRTGRRTWGLADGLGDWLVEGIDRLELRSLAKEELEWQTCWGRID